jgi:hypothetical protein
MRIASKQLSVPDAQLNDRHRRQPIQLALDGWIGGLSGRGLLHDHHRTVPGLARVEGVVVKLLSSALELPPGARPKDALRTLGLEKFAPPILLSGQINFGSAELSAAAPLYFGVPPGEVHRVRIRAKPRYFLTIENFASFNRHVAEADPGRAGLTVYVGGYCPNLNLAVS